MDDHLHALAQNMYERLCMHRKVYRATKKKFVFENFFKKLFCSHSEIKYKVEKIPEAVTQTTASEILAQGFSSNNFFFFAEHLQMTPSEVLRHLDKFYIETENERVTQLTFVQSQQ